MIINVQNNIKLSSFYIVFGGSTMQEHSGNFGASHICEHLVCKSFKHLYDDFQRYGISWNAYTSSSEVVFFMTGLRDFVDGYKYPFLDAILNYNPTEEDLENEKKIVLEEYKDAFNQQSYSHYLNLHRKVFGSYNPLGLRSDIENFTIEDCREYLNLFYKKPTKIINVGKGHHSDFKRDIDFRENINYKPIYYKETPKENFFLIKEDDDLYKIPKGKIPLELINDFNSKSSIINLSPVITEDFTYVNFVCSMLSSGLNSPLYQEVREKLGLVYYIQCDNDKINDASSVITISTETSNENVQIVQDTIANVLKNKEQFLTQERFDIVKDNILVKLQKNDILRHENVSKYLNPQSWNIENIINTITLDDVYRIVDKYFQWDNFYKSVWSEEFSE